MKQRLENPNSSPTDRFIERKSIHLSEPFNSRQQDLLRRCVSLMLPPPPIISRQSVPEIEVHSMNENDLVSINFYL